jgi:hypothetical protein
MTYQLHGCRTLKNKSEEQQDPMYFWQVHPNKNKRTAPAAVCIQNTLDSPVPDLLPLFCWPEPAYLARLVLQGQNTFEPGFPFWRASGMNRFYLLDARGAVRYTLPLEGGRNHPRTLGAAVLQAPEQWALAHWKRIENTYRRAPYFEYLGPTAKALFAKPEPKLMDYSLHALAWIMNLLDLPLGMPVSLEATDSSQAQDLLRRTRNAAPLLEEAPEYYQHFGDKTGFVPHLSTLDLLFQCGPRESRRYLDALIPLVAP